MAVLIPVTDTGIGEFVNDPSPSAPYWLKPQHLIAPLASSAQLCRSPIAIALAVLIPVTVTGGYEIVLDPSPSPWVLDPQHWTEPLTSSAQLYELPAATAM